MATEETTPRRCYRRLKRACDDSTVSVAVASSSSKRMRIGKEHDSNKDMISNLPDDILVLILDRLDPRTTIATTILSKRWQNLPQRSTTCYDLAADDILPPRYARVKRLWKEAKATFEVAFEGQNGFEVAFEGQKGRRLASIYARREWDHSCDRQMKRMLLNTIYARKDHNDWQIKRILLLNAVLQRYERWAMRCYVKRVDVFLLPPDGVSRTIQNLRLQTFGRLANVVLIKRWVGAAICKWGVEDLELDIDKLCISFDFDSLLDGSQNVRLKRLVLSNCLPRSFDSLVFQRLTKLSLCKGAFSGGASDILQSCVHLVDFSIRYCRYFGRALRFSVPTSRLKNLLVDNCRFQKIYLGMLPCLETFVCRSQQPIKLYYGEVPRLRHVSLDYLGTGSSSNIDVSNTTYPWSKFVKRMPSIESLVLQFKGPEVWIEPMALPSPLSHLRMLFIANVPLNWDIFWIVALLDAAPVLESCHVHIDSTPEKVSPWADLQAQEHQYHCLKDLVVVNFDAVGWQVGFVRHVMKASPWLRLVHLLYGHIIEDDERVPGGLEVVPHRQEWHECDRSQVLDELCDGICSPQLKILIGQRNDVV